MFEPKSSTLPGACPNNIQHFDQFRCHIAQFRRFPVAHSSSFNSGPHWITFHLHTCWSHQQLTATMGQAISVVREQLKNDNAEQQKQDEADLNNLATLLDARMQEYHTKLVHATGEDKTVPIKTVIEYKTHTSVNVSTEPSKQLNDAIEDLFGGNFLSSLKAATLAAGRSHKLGMSLLLDELYLIINRPSLVVHNLVSTTL